MTLISFQIQLEIEVTVKTLNTSASVGMAGLLQPVFCLPGAALWADRSGVMEKAALSRGECPLSAHTQLLI